MTITKEAIENLLRSGDYLIRYREGNVILGEDGGYMGYR